MIIEIKDIPQDRKIKYINVNITFDDQSYTSVFKEHTAGKAQEDNPKDFQHPPKDQMMEDVVKTAEHFEDRESKPIPEEMKETTF